MISLDYTVILQMINFVIIFFLSKKMILEPVMRTIDKRDRKIALLSDDAKTFEDELEKNKRDYEKRIDDVKNDLLIHRNSVIVKAEKEANAKINRVKDNLDKKMQEFRDELNLQYEEAKTGIEKDIDMLSEDVVNVLLGGMKWEGSKNR